MPLACREVFLRLSDYLDGDLPPQLCERIRRHLAACPNCGAFTSTLRKTVELCRKLPQHPVPPEVRRTLRTMVRVCRSQDRLTVHRRGPH